MAIEVTPRLAMNYAAGVQDTAPVYYDDTQDRLPVHPMLPTALTWRLSKAFPAHWPVEGFPAAVIARQVHAHEHLDWHRPLFASETVTLRGRIEAIIPHRAGTAMCLRYAALDAHGNPVFTEHITGIFRGVQCTGGGQGELPKPPGMPGDAPNAGGWKARIDIPDLAAHQYDAGSGISFPIHTSRRAAATAGFPQPILHGTATLAYAVRDVVHREAEGRPERVRKIACRFSHIVIPGESIWVRVQHGVDTPEGRYVAFDVVNSGGNHAIRGGHIEIGHGRSE